VSSFFKDIREIVDPRFELSEEQIVSLVEEKFTSTNTDSTKSLCDNCLCDCILEDFCDSEGFSVSKCQRHRTI